MKRFLTTTALALSLVSGTAAAAPVAFLTDANKDEAFVEVADLGQFLTRLLGEGGSAQWSYNDDDDYDDDDDDDDDNDYDDDDNDNDYDDDDDDD